MSVLTTPPDASERHRSEPALGERGHVIGNSVTAGKVHSRPIPLLIASSIALIAAVAIATTTTVANLRSSALAESERELGRATAALFPW